MRGGRSTPPPAAPVRLPTTSPRGCLGTRNGRQPTPVQHWPPGASPTSRCGRWRAAGAGGALPLLLPAAPSAAALPAPAHSLHPCPLARLACPQQTGSIYASALSQLGLVMGTSQTGRDFLSLYLEPAFTSTNFVRTAGWLLPCCCRRTYAAAAAGVLAPPDAACRRSPLTTLRRSPLTTLRPLHSPVQRDAAQRGGGPRLARQQRFHHRA